MVEWKKLGEVCDFQNGFAFKSNLFKTRGNPIIRITNITSNNVDMTDCKFFDMHDYSKYNLSSFEVAYDNILLAMSGATTGKIGLYKGQQKAYINQRVGKFVPHTKSLSNGYLYHYLLSKTVDLYIMAGGGAQPNLSSNKLMDELIIPIPSLEEQTRIVGILDTFTSAIDNLKEQIAQRRKQYEYYRDQLLDLEGKPGVEMKTLGEISTFSQGIQVPLENQSLANKEGYFRFLRIIDFTQGNEPPRYVPISDKRYWISSDEIAIVRYGTPGFVCRGLEGILANNMFKVIIKDKGLLGNSFLSSLLKSKIFQTPIKQKSSGGALQAISFGLIKDISVPVPPLQEQQRIVTILDTFEASIQNLEAQLKQREKQYEYYRNKLLTFE